MKILVSSCLLGLDCRYSGSSHYTEEVSGLAAVHTLIPVCPEQMGGLPTPREPAERRGSRVVARDGSDYTRAFEKGSLEVLKVAELFGCTCAVLKSRSPSCGCGTIYDGTFSGTLIEGNGVTAEMLLNAGIRVADEMHTDSLF